MVNRPEWVVGVFGSPWNLDVLSELLAQLIKDDQINASTAMAALLALVFCLALVQRRGILLVDLPIFDKAMVFIFVLLLGCMMIGSAFNVGVPGILPWMSTAVLVNQIVRTWTQPGVK